MVNQTINAIKFAHITNKFHVRLHNKFAVVCKDTVYPSNRDIMEV